ncbi:MAG TPA: twin-arginine translocation signal domain-containing protein [Candidatus Binatia bacterium]|nr:twin-arginine translocation signal domain-containing protein [Candidatus Binatia bacterium]
MKDPKGVCKPGVPVQDEDSQGEKRQPANGPNDSSRRSFLSRVGVGGAAAVALAALPLEPMIEGKHGQAEASTVHYGAAGRMQTGLNYRKNTAVSNIGTPIELPDNGDLQRYADYSGNWSKCLQHDALGIPNRAAYQSMLYALTTGGHSDFENMLVGNPGGTGFTSTMNGPEGAFTFDLEGRDSHATVIPPAPSVASAQSAAEAVEHYWAALMRDVQFKDYLTSSLAAQACADLNNLSYVRQDNSIFPYPVMPQNLFRGQFFRGDDNLKGPYISQFLIQPTFFGAQAISCQNQRFRSVGEGGADYLTDPTEYLNVQNGFLPSASLVFDDTPRYFRMGRDGAAMTHVDFPFQEYLVALFLIAQMKTPVNPGNPYGYPHGRGRATHGFVTFGSEFCNLDAGTTLTEMSTRALKAAWFHKWIVNLRMRPEEYGALVHANLTHQNPMPLAAQALHHDVLNSLVLSLIHSQYHSFLLPQAFPEGAPTHPCYPTGHGTAGGACITALKFFYDGNAPIRPLLQSIGSDVMVPSADGLSLELYTGADRDSLTINGELTKLGWNVSLGHGIHAGIHFRSSSLYSLLLGEQVGISVLQDRARGYTEPFTIHITKFDGTTATISNQS